MADRDLRDKDNLRGFDDEMRAAGVPIGSDDPDRGDMRVYPQIEPIILDWIANYRTRFSERADWQNFMRRVRGIVASSGEQPELATALITEYRALIPLDFMGAFAPGTCYPVFKEMFLHDFDGAIARAAGPEHYSAIRELVLDPRFSHQCGGLMIKYFGRSRNPDLPVLVAEAFVHGQEFAAAHIAGVQGLTQFLPHVRELARSVEYSDNVLPLDDLRDTIYKLERKLYAEINVATTADDLIGDLDHDDIAPFAAYVLGVRKELHAVDALEVKLKSPITRVRQEAQSALKKIDRRHKLTSEPGRSSRWSTLITYQTLPRPQDYYPVTHVMALKGGAYLNRFDSFYVDLVRAGLSTIGALEPHGDDDVHPDVRLHPEIEPVLIEWIGNFRKRLDQGMQWALFVWKITGIACASGEQPGLVKALVAEFWNLVDLDFTDVELPGMYEGQPEDYKFELVQNFCIPIVHAAGPDDYAELRKIVFDEKTSEYSLYLVKHYFGESDNWDLPAVLIAAMSAPDPAVKWSAAHIAAVRGFTEFLPRVRELANDSDTVGEADPSWINQLKNDVAMLERKLLEENDNSMTHRKDMDAMNRGES